MSNNTNTLLIIVGTICLIFAGAIVNAHPILGLIGAILGGITWGATIHE